MNFWQAVLLVILIWIAFAPLVAFKAARDIGGLKKEPDIELPSVQIQYIDTLIDDVLDTQEGADAWLEHKKMIVAEVFAKGEAWCDVQGNLVEKGDPDAVSHITFNVIRAAMMKFYAAGIQEMPKGEGHDLAENI